MLSNYIIEKQLGKGTYGVVYKVKKKDDNKIYVLKQISLIGLTQAQKEEVKLEAQVLSKIKSKYVVKYYDSFEEEGKLNIIMEYCDNGDLNDFIERQKQTKHLLSENIVWKIFIKITLGLADIHKLKILHRDLKALNIFLKKDDDIRVGDLGVAKILNQTFFAKTFIGTPYYLSPEICEDKPYNDKSDVWALGCILYELCTFQHPFTAKSQGGLILKILNDTPKPIHTYYSKEISNLLNLIFVKDYQKRPSCLEILKMKFVIDKAKTFGIFEDIKNSFPEIDNCGDNIDNKDKNNNIKMKNNLLKIKPVIIKSNKNEVKKRPASGFGLFGRKEIHHKNIKFNDIGYDKKRNENVKVLCIDKSENNVKKKGFISKNIKIIKKDKNMGKYNIPIKQVRKKAIVSPKKKDREKGKEINLLFKEAELFDQKRVNKINLNDIHITPSEKVKNILSKNENLSILDTKVLNNLMNKDIECSIFNEKEKEKENNNSKEKQIQDSIFNTKEFNNIFNNKDKSIFNEVKNNNNENLVKNTDTKIDFNKFDYSRDSNYLNFGKEDGKNNEIKKEEIINNEIKEEENNNISSIESDIYKTALRDKYQPKKEEDEKKENNENKEEEKKLENNDNNKEEEEPKLIFKKDTQSSGSSINFTELIKDFSPKEETIINQGTKSDFKIIVNNEDENDVKLNIHNIDNNKSISDENDDGDKNYFSNDDKYEENEEGEEKVEEIDIKMENNDKLNELRNKIQFLKKQISQLLGEEKYKYIMEICTAGIKDIDQDEVNEKIEKFIKENSNENNKEKFYDITQLFISECQYYKMQKSL